MIVRLTLEEALKWAFRDFLLDEWRARIDCQLCDIAILTGSLTPIGH
jgi:hypothetical protein